MRFKLTGQWQDGYEQDGILYCVQRIEEMLMDYTSHIYKVPVYNTFLLCHEYLSVYDYVKDGMIEEAHLSYILEDL